LDRIAAGLAVPVAGRDVGVDPARGQPLEGDDRRYHAVRAAAIGSRDCDAAQDAVPPAAQELQARPRLGLALGLGQDAPAAGHHRIGGQHPASGMPGGDRRQLPTRHALRIGERQLARPMAFVDMGRVDERRLDPDLPQQIAPPRRTRSQDKLLGPGVTHRHR
jgi:hypothetical protein